MSEMVRLRRIMEHLRGPEGCPWDREQTLETLRTYLTEEAHEVIAAIDAGSPEALREELGDLLLQILFQARVAEESGAFDIEAVMKGIGDKIVSRHPHVFASGRLDNAEQVLAQWEQLKADERRGRQDASMFAGVPDALPALLKALRISSKAARVGFDWSDAAGVWSKIEEEMAELADAVRRGERAPIAEEIGDLLFTIVNLARHQDVDPEQALQAANRKFIERFRYIEEALTRDGKRPAPEERDRMEALWREAKTAIKRTSPGRTSPSGGTSGSGPRPDPPRKSA
jgi:tetrapyrrole methylase family protein/MazG family protein